MSEGLARTEIIGNVVADAELRESRSNTKFTTFTVAVNLDKKVHEEWISDAHYFKIVLFGERAERLAPHVKKSMSMRLTGLLKAEAYFPRDWKEGDELGISYVLFPDYDRHSIKLFGVSQKNEKDVADSAVTDHEKTTAEEEEAIAKSVDLFAREDTKQ